MLLFAEAVPQCSRITGDYLFSLRLNFRAGGNVHKVLSMTFCHGRSPSTEQARHEPKTLDGEPQQVAPKIGAVGVVSEVMSVRTE